MTANPCLRCSNFQALRNLTVFVMLQITYLHVPNEIKVHYALIYPIYSNLKIFVVTGIVRLQLYLQSETVFMKLVQ